MAVVHQICEAGGEGYLPWALARERQLRLSGVEVGARRYDVDGVQIEIILRGDVSHVFVRGTSGSSHWVLLPCDASFLYSDGNIIRILPAPDLPKPVAPVKPPYPPGPVWSFSPTPAQWVNCGEGIPSWQNSWVGGVDAYNAVVEAGGRAMASVARVYYKLIWGDSFNPDPDWWPIPNGAVGPIGCSTGSDGIPRSIPGFVYEWGEGPYMEAYIAYDAASKAHAAACAAIDAAYGAAFVAYTEAMTEWNSAVFDARVSAHYSAGRAQRASQVAAVIAEQDSGLVSQLVSMPVLRPAYVPREEHVEAFCVSTPYRGDSVTSVDQQVWGGVGSRSSMPATATKVEVSTPAQGTELVPAVEVSGLHAATTVEVGDITFGPFRTSAARGFGFSVDGVMAATANTASEVGAMAVTPITSYAEWYGTVRQRGTKPIAHDLIPPGSAGTVLFAFLEFYAYDFQHDQWVWLPARKLQISQAVGFDDLASMHPYLTAHRQLHYPDIPALGESVSAIRSRRFVRQKVGADGVFAAAELLTDVQGMSFQLADYPGVTRDDLFDFVAVVRGLDPWALPQDQSLRSGFTGVVPAFDTTSDPGSALLRDLYAACLNRLGI